MPARPFTHSEICLLESRLLSRHRLRDRMLLVVGTNVGYRITELLTWTAGQVLTREGDVVREVTVTSPVVTARYFESAQSELDELVLGLAQSAPAASAMPAFALAS